MKKDKDNTYIAGNNKHIDYSDKANNAASSYTKGDPENGGKKTLNRDFVQINIKYQDDIAQLALTDSVAMCIFTLMYTRMEENNTILLNQSDLAECLQKTLRTIKRAIRTLKEKDFIKVYKFGVENIYFINPNVACKVSASYKQNLIVEYAKKEKYNKDGNGQSASSKQDKKESTIDIGKLIKEERLVVKKDFNKQHRELEKPSPYDVNLLMMLKEVFDWLPHKLILEMHDFLEENDTHLTQADQADIRDYVMENMDLGLALRLGIAAHKQPVEPDPQVDYEPDPSGKPEPMPEATQGLLTPPEGFDASEDDPFGLLAPAGILQP